MEQKFLLSAPENSSNWNELVASSFRF